MGFSPCRSSPARAEAHATWKKAIALDFVGFALDDRRLPLHTQDIQV